MEIEKEIAELKQTLERLENSIKINAQASLEILDIIRRLGYYGDAYIETKYERCYVNFEDSVYRSLEEAEKLLNKLLPKSEEDEEDED